MFTQLQCQIIVFADIYCIVNFDHIFVQLNTSRFQGNFDFNCEFLQSKIILRRIFKTRGYFKQMLSKNLLYLVLAPLIIINLSFFKNAIKSDPLGVPFNNRYYDHCKNVFYPFSQQQFSGKHIPSSKSCNLLVQTIIEKMEPSR